MASCRTQESKKANLGMNDDLWDEVRGLGSETWKGCE